MRVAILMQDAVPAGISGHTGRQRGILRVTRETYYLLIQILRLPLSVPARSQYQQLVPSECLYAPALYRSTVA